MAPGKSLHLHHSMVEDIIWPKGKEKEQECAELVLYTPIITEESTHLADPPCHHFLHVLPLTTGTIAIKWEGATSNLSTLLNLLFAFEYPDTQQGKFIAQGHTSVSKWWSQHLQSPCLQGSHMYTHTNTETHACTCIRAKNTLRSIHAYNLCYKMASLCSVLIKQVILLRSEG